MNLKEVTLENIDNEHICCAITEKKGETCVSSKKAWLKERMKEGLKFVKLDVRGKVFIEYIPSEYAWCPLDAKDDIFINCFWVSGHYKGQGYANQLLDYCIQDAKKLGKKGLVVLSSSKKKSFLSDPKYLKYKGFQIADTCENDFELLYLPLTADAMMPQFKECVKQEENNDGFVLYYTNQCPHTDKYAPLLVEIAKKQGITIHLAHIQNMQEAQSLPIPVSTYALLYNGQFITNEVLSEKSFQKILDKLKIEL